MTLSVQNMAWETLQVWEKQGDRKVCNFLTENFMKYKLFASCTTLNSNNMHDHKMASLISLNFIFLKDIICAS
jgi:hypothetical protein